MANYDYVIVGAGSAGCVVAARLCEDARLPARLRVTDGVTSGTPHGGTRFASRCAGRAEQCAQLVPDSRFLTNLGQHPQGVGGTEPTLSGSRRDEYVPACPAVAMRLVSSSRPLAKGTRGTPIPSCSPSRCR